MSFLAFGIMLFYMLCMLCFPVFFLHYVGLCFLCIVILCFLVYHIGLCFVCIMSFYISGIICCARLSVQNVVS